MLTPRSSDSDEEKRVDVGSPERANDKEFSPDTDFGGPVARKALEKRLLLKIDLRMSMLIVIYILNFVDRNNAAAARLRGFEADLHLKGNEFATLLSILYVGYVIIQIPSHVFCSMTVCMLIIVHRNMFLNWIGRPSLYLPACTIIWGIISCLTGITHNFVGALLTRFFLGFAEAAFFPGALFLLSKWYTRRELSSRMAVLYCGNIISTAFGALLASAILDSMHGKLGHASWRWLFYIEGALTVFIAIIAIFVLPDFPETTRWLTPEERALAIRRMEEDEGTKDSDRTGHIEGFWMAVKDWRVWWISIATTSQVISMSFSAYFPTLSQTMGFNRTITLVLCAPPFIVSAFTALLVSRHSDKVQERFYHIVIPIGMAILGFIIAICTMNTGARYFSFFLMAQSYAGIPPLFAWVVNTFPRPTAKRAVALAFFNGCSTLGPIAGSYVWPRNWGPTYRYSYGICISTSGLAVIMFWIYYRIEQQSKDRRGLFKA